MTPHAASERSPAPAADSAPAANAIVIDGRRLTLFGGCNYLGLAHHARVAAAARAALDRFGVSTAASRTTTGDTALHRGLEATLDGFFGSVLPRRTATLTIDGMTANIAAFEALAPERTTAVIDERAHRSLPLAARAAGLGVVTYAHADADDAQDRVTRLGPDRCVVATDSVFASVGSVAPLADLLDALPRDVAVIVDECHGVGVLGPGGRGLVAEVAPAAPRIVVTATLAKAVGAHGGVVVAGDAITDVVRTRATAYVGVTPIAPAVAAAAAEAIRVIDAEPERLERLRRNAGLVLGRDTARTPIAIVEPSDPTHAARLARAWDAAGLYVPLISYPGGPSRPYFRVSVTSEHAPGEIDRLRAIAAEHGATLCGGGDEA